MYPEGRFPGLGANLGLDSVSHYFLSLIKSRRSVRKYRRMRPELSEIDRVLECAIHAPSAHNAQPWRFFIVNDNNKKRELIEQMAARFRQDMEGDSVSPTVTRQRIGRSIQLFTDAPVVIIACIDMGGMDKYPDLKRQQAEMTMAIQSLGAAIQNLLLAAKALGLGACWYCAPLFCPETVQTVLSLSAYHIPQALITLGYPGESPPVPRRTQLDEIRFII